MGIKINGCACMSDLSKAILALYIKKDLEIAARKMGIDVDKEVFTAMSDLHIGVDVTPESTEWSLWYDTAAHIDIVSGYNQEAIFMPR